MIPSRKMISQGNIKMKSNPTKWNHEYKYILCNDILLIVEKNNSYKDIVYFEKALCNDVPSIIFFFLFLQIDFQNKKFINPFFFFFLFSENIESNNFELVHLHKMKKLIFTTKTLEQKEDLMGKIKNFIQVFLDKYKKEKGTPSTPRTSGSSTDKSPIQSPRIERPKEESLSSKIEQSIEKKDSSTLLELTKDSQFASEINKMESLFFNKNVSTSEEFCEILLKNGANLNKKDKDGNTPILNAIKNNQEKVLKVFLEHIKINSKEENSELKQLLDTPDNNGETPLIFASKNNKKIFELLVNHGANIKQQHTESKQTLFHHLFFVLEKEWKDFKTENFLFCVDLLIEKGCSVNALDSHGYSPLHRVVLVHSSQNDFPAQKFLDFLFSKNADVNLSSNDEGNTPIHLAVKHNNLELVKSILKNAQIDLEKLNSLNKTPLSYAMSLENINQNIRLSLSKKKIEIKDEDEEEDEESSLSFENMKKETLSLKNEINEDEDEIDTTADTSDEDDKVLEEFRKALKLAFGVDQFPLNKKNAPSIRKKTPRSKPNMSILDEDEEDDSDSSDSSVEQMLNIIKSNSSKFQNFKNNKSVQITPKESRNNVSILEQSNDIILAGSIELQPTVYKENKIEKKPQIQINTEKQENKVEIQKKNSNPILVHANSSGDLLESSGELVIAKFPYKAEKKGHVTFKKGDLVKVLKRSQSGWWTGEVNGLKGKFPGKKKKIFFLPLFLISIFLFLFF